MKLSLDKVESLCKERDLSTAQMLRDAGVSRNAFYTLARKDSVIPPSLMRIADRLGVPVSDLLEAAIPTSIRMRSLAAEINRISRKYKRLDRDNVRHTLLLLDEKPIERLRGGLQRGRSFNFR